jgi:hypothetical protein
MTTLTRENDNFYLTDEKIKDSPSFQDGVDEETAFRLAVYGCELIQEGVGLALHSRGMSLAWLHAGCHQLNRVTVRPPALLGLLLPGGVRLDWCFDFAKSKV